MEGDDLEPAMLAVNLRIDRPNELVPVEDRHRPEAPHAEVLRNVDLNAVPHAEEQLGALAIDDQVVEGRQQGRPVDRLAWPIEIPCEREARTAQAGDLDTPRDAFALEAHERVLRDEPPQGVDAPELLEGRDPGGRKSTLGRAARGDRRGHGVEFGKPVLGEGEEASPGGASTDRDLTEPDEEREHLRHVTVGVPAGRGPGMDGPVLERAERKWSFLPQAGEHVPAQDG